MGVRWQPQSTGAKRMSLVWQARLSDSPLVESITRGRTLSEGSTIRPAESNWHMVLVKVNGAVLPLVVGPLMTSGIASWGDGGEILWIKFKLGVHMPNLPLKSYTGLEMKLPDA